MENNLTRLLKGFLKLDSDIHSANIVTACNSTGYIGLIGPICIGKKSQKTQSVTLME